MLRVLLDGRRDPPAGIAQRALAQLRAGAIAHQALPQAPPVQLPDAAATHEKRPIAFRSKRRGVRMDSGAVRQLPDLAIRKTGLEQLRAARAVGGEQQRLRVRRE